MGIFSEIADEMAEKAYQRGLIDGIFWPISLVRWGIEKIYLGGFLLSIRIKERFQKPVQTPPEIIIITPMPTRGMSWNKLKEIETDNKEIKNE